MAPRVLAHPGTRPTATKEATVDERILAHPRNPQEKPKTAVCSGCGGKYPHRELIELHEDNHDNLTYFHGDQLCRSCADGAGVEH
jgi:hypothetical protein